MRKNYLAENPDKTAEDFLKLKALSDEIYHQQIIVENRTSRLDVSIHALEETEVLSTESPDSEIIHNSDTEQAMEAAQRLLKSGELTEIQQRRFLMHFFKGYSYRKIAAREDVFFTSVAESITDASRKLKKYFDGMQSCLIQ